MKTNIFVNFLSLKGNVSKKARIFCYHYLIVFALVVFYNETSFVFLFFSVRITQLDFLLRVTPPRLRSSSAAVVHSLPGHLRPPRILLMVPAAPRPPPAPQPRSHLAHRPAAASLFQRNSEPGRRGSGGSERRQGGS